MPQWFDKTRLLLAIVEHHFRFCESQSPIFPFTLYWFTLRRALQRVNGLSPHFEQEVHSTARNIKYKNLCLPVTGEHGEERTHFAEKRAMEML